MPIFFLKQNVLILLKITNLNQYIIKLEKYKQLLYKVIYSLEIIKFKFDKFILKPILLIALFGF